MSSRSGHLRALPAPVKDPSGRPPPHHLDAQHSVLSYAMSAGTIGDVQDLLQPEDFFGEECLQVATICWELHKRGVGLDVVTIANELRQRGLDRRVPISWLGDVVDACPTVTNVRDHAKIVAQHARSRRLIALCQQVAAEGYGDVGDRDQWLLDSVRKIAGIAEQIPAESAVSLNESACVAMGKIWDVIERRGKLSGLSTGLDELDELTAGLHGGDVTLVTAKTKGGKTALACQEALTVAKQGRGALFFSLEMPHEQLSTRMICSQGRVNYHAIRLGRQTESDYSALISASEELGSLPLTIDRHRGMRVRELLGRAKRAAKDFAAAGTPLGLIVVDYIQILECRDEVGPRETRERALAAGARRLVEMAEELDVAVMVLAQTNEDGQVRESKAILHEATGWWDIHVDQDGKGPRSTEIRIPVQRHGPSDVTACCWFHPGYLLFSDSDVLPLT